MFDLDKTDHVDNDSVLWLLLLSKPGALIILLSKLVESTSFPSSIKLCTSLWEYPPVAALVTKNVCGFVKKNVVNVLFCDISMLYLPTPPVVPLTCDTIFVFNSISKPPIIWFVVNVPPVIVRTSIVVPVIIQVPFNIVKFCAGTIVYVPTPPVVPLTCETIVVLTSIPGPARICPGAKLLSLTE